MSIVDLGWRCTLHPLLIGDEGRWIDMESDFEMLNGKKRWYVLVWKQKEGFNDDIYFHC
jgi:hypothetical protein